MNSTEPGDIPTADDVQQFIIISPCLRAIQTPMLWKTLVSIQFQLLMAHMSKDINHQPVVVSNRNDPFK